MAQPRSTHEDKEYAPSVPLPLKLFALLFILAPFGNLYLGFRSMRIPNAFIWEHLGMLLKLVSGMDFLRMSLTFVGGLALLKARKSSWAFALVAVGAALAFSLRDLFFQNSAQHIPSGYLFLFLSSSICAAFVLYFFRFPYLDRRDTWWGITVRHEVDLPIEYRFDSSQWIPGRILNISNSGALIQATGPLQGQKIEVRFSPELTLAATVHRAANDLLGVEFYFNSLKNHSMLRRKLRELPKHPHGKEQKCA